MTRASTSARWARGPAEASKRATRIVARGSEQQDHERGNEPRGSVAPNAASEGALAPLGAALRPDAAAAWRCAIGVLASATSRACCCRDTCQVDACREFAEGLAAHAHAVAEEATPAERAQANARWQAWVEQALAGGAAVAHAYARPLEAISRVT